jgi:hypothetical protein
VSSDLQSTLARLLKAGARPALVEIPELRFLMVDGEGPPQSSPRFHEAIQALYTFSYTARFALKERNVAWKVAALEGLWWSATGGPPLPERPDDWRWTVMIAQPEELDGELLQVCREKAAAKGIAVAGEVRLESFAEGLCAQILHVGPYAAEGPTLETLNAFIRDNALEPAGRHHEIYLSDPSRTPAEKVKTILRQPVRSA